MIKRVCHFKTLSKIYRPDRIAPNTLTLLSTLKCDQLLLQVTTWIKTLTIGLVYSKRQPTQWIKSLINFRTKPTGLLKLLNILQNMVIQLSGMNVLMESNHIQIGHKKEVDSS